MKTYWVDTKFACGAVTVDADRITETAPIFKSWLGGSFHKFLKKYRPTCYQLKEPSTQSKLGDQ
jgi:hypothetical protein